MQLRTYQRDAVEFLLPRRRAFVVAPAGSGKTIMAAAAVARRVEPGWTVGWLCNTIEQKQQAVAAISRVEGPENVSFIVECAAARPDLSSCQLVVVDECFPAGTLVDGRPIEGIGAGESVSAFDHSSNARVARKVLQTFSRPFSGAWVRLRAAGATLICTEGHPVYVRGFGYVTARSIVDSLERGRPPQTVHRVRQDVAHNPQPPDASSQILLDPVPLGGVEGPAASRRVASSSGGELNDSSGVVVRRVRGGVLRAAENAGQRDSSRREPSVLLGSLRPHGSLCRELREDAPDEPERLRGSRQADERTEPDEGPGDAGAHAEQDARPDLPVPRWKRAAHPAAGAACGTHRAADGISYSYRSGQGTFPQSAELLQGGPCKLGGKASRGGGREVPSSPSLEILRCSQDGNTSFVRLDSAEIYERTGGPRPDWVPRCDMVYNLEVEEYNNYFAGGVLVHNCHHAPAEGTWLPAIRSAKDAILWGFSATPWHDSDVDRNKLVRDTFVDFHTITRDLLLDDGHLAAGKVWMHDLDAPGQYDREIEAQAAFEVIRRCRRFPGIPRFEHERRVRWQVTQEFLQANEARNACAVALVLQEVAAGHSTLVLVGSIEHGEKIAERVGPEAVLVHSKLAKKRRAQLIEEFRSGERLILFATSLADEGLDVPRASRLVLLSGGRSSGKLEQRAGRVLRPAPGKSGGVIHDFLDAGACFALAQARARLRVYERLGYEPEVVRPTCYATPTW